MKPKRRRWPKYLTLVVLCALIAGVLLERQTITDAIKLHGYTAPQAVANLAHDDTMTAKAIHLLYVNKPDITTGADFTDHCPKGGEKTVVLGCYVGNDDGIYIYQVTDPRLNGVEQVTAAHEMLHAAYQRLSNSKRQQVDAWLTNYYEHDLTDQRIKDTIAAYKKSEPNDVVNEMHSVFGTEVANLPAPLENYYKQYFTDRSKVTAYTAEYQAEFTGRQAQIATYDSQLASLKQQIDVNNAQLKADKQNLNAQNQQMSAERSSGQTGAYNAAVPSYNAAIDAYNALIGSTQQLVDRYNGIVSSRNNIVLEEQQLSQALTASNQSAQ